MKESAITNETSIEKPPAGQDTAVKPRKSKGEKLFDMGVYGVMNYLGTFLLTIPLAYGIKHGRFKTKYDAIDKYIGEKGLHDGKITGTIVKATQETVITFWGGNAMLLPVWALEHFKVSIANKLNQWLGDPASPEEIQEAPKQTVGTLLKARAVSFTTVFALMLTANFAFGKKFEAFKDFTGNLFVKRLARAGKEEKAFHLGHMAALDVFATAASTSLLYVTSHIFARKREQKIEQREEYQLAKIEPLVQKAIEKTAIIHDIPSAQIAGSKQHDGVALRRRSTSRSSD